MNRVMMIGACVAAVVAVGCVSRQTVKVNETKVLKKGRITYQGGAGDSYETAVVIVGPKDQKEGVAAEYDYITMQYGAKGKEWRVSEQGIVREQDKVYDMIAVEVIGADQTHYVYFDITNCAWKPKGGESKTPVEEEQQQQ